MGKAPEGIRNTLIQVYLAVVKDATNPVGQRLGSVMQEGEQLMQEGQAMQEEAYEQPQY